MKTATLDRNDNPIGNGTFHANYSVVEFPNYPQISASVSKSETTETVYVRYYNEANGESITCRFSWHENNAVKFGDQLNGYIADENKILHRLGLKTRTWIADTRPYIHSRSVKKSMVDQYEIAPLTIHEMYDLGIGADLSEFTGKLAKDSNRLITGEKIETVTENTGHYIYQ